MKTTINNQSRRAGIALVAVAFVTFGTATALAAPPTSVPTFAMADIDIETRGEEAGSLACSWRETGLGHPGAGILRVQCGGWRCGGRVLL